ncbi:hypothetical protein, partial [Pseudonocardia sp. D17]|uniref:hypothetical protein n=1 Tax=Pseudonocardia sp. D17 TaxID=882661 RepID=UPI0030CC2345
DRYWRPAASGRGYTLDCEEPDIQTSGQDELPEDVARWVHPRSFEEPRRWAGRVPLAVSDEQAFHGMHVPRRRSSFRIQGDHRMERNLARKLFCSTAIVSITPD